MLKKYKNIIYKDENSEKKVTEDCVKYVISLYPNIEPDNVRKSILSGENSNINCDYNFALLQTEGIMLFNIAVEKFGIPLWNSQAWRKANCSEKCPFGNMCKKFLVQIDSEMFCYGQLTAGKTGENELAEMTKEHRVIIHRQNSEVYIDMNCKDYDKQLLSGFFFEYEWFIWWFGDNGGRGRVNGDNVIPYL